MKAYIGDSVYVEAVDGSLKLTTENGYGPRNTIYLDRDTFISLLKFAERQDVKEIFR